ncbi:MAG: OmpA/MotB protein [Circular genetic element sp.]|nr:MAG: OmpA/MotB protein [Circular genetic element sp.]
MTAFYILSEGDFSGVRYQNLERIAMASAHETLQRVTNTGLGVGFGISSIVPGPLGAPVRKTLGIFAGGVRLVTGSKAVDAYMRKEVKKEIRRRFDDQGRYHKGGAP